jgi:hypothetical protein
MSTKKRPLRVYKDKNGYFVINKKKKKYLPEKMQGEPIADILKMVVKKLLVRRKRRPTQRAVRQKYAPADSIPTTVTSKGKVEPVATLVGIPNQPPRTEYLQPLAEMERIRRFQLINDIDKLNKQKDTMEGRAILDRLVTSETGTVAKLLTNVGTLIEQIKKREEGESPLRGNIEDSEGKQEMVDDDEQQVAAPVPVPPPSPDIGPIDSGSPRMRMPGMPGSQPPPLDKPLTPPPPVPPRPKTPINPVVEQKLPLGKEEAASSVPPVSDYKEVTAGVENNQASFFESISRALPPNSRFDSYTEADRAILKSAWKKMNLINKDNIIDVLVNRYNLNPNPSLLKNQLVALLARVDKGAFLRVGNLKNVKNTNFRNYYEQPGSGAGAMDDNDRSGRFLWSDQINDILSDLPGFLGTISSDEIPRIIQPALATDGNFCFVMNTAPSTEEGDHWVAIYCSIYDDMEINYYDPLGDEPSKEFLISVKQLIDAFNINYYLKMKINRVRRQQSNTTTCGYHAIRFLRKRQHQTFEKASGYDDIRRNETAVQKMRDKFKRFGYI